MRYPVVRDREKHLPLLHIGEEDRRILDMAAIIYRNRNSDLVEQALGSATTGT